MLQMIVKKVQVDEELVVSSVSAGRRTVESQRVNRSWIIFFSCEHAYCKKNTANNNPIQYFVFEYDSETILGLISEE